MSTFDPVAEFENRIAEFFGAPFAVCTDSCTHAVELCLRLSKPNYINCPKRTYLSIPMLANKLGIQLLWRNENWKDAYSVSANIIDAAVLWRANSYEANSFMCLSFQYQKHLSLSRGGMILCDNKEAAVKLKKMSYDGRLPNIPWREQNVTDYGFHYYATPETCQLGLDKLQKAIDTEPRQWSYLNYPDLTQMEVFKRNI